ncbi:hypothetical protein F503_00827 [Ophiostoma piceae UAMH 11346]|uniref:Uncharacterized protein n=1 Tax=Ophiostoma piceae (strain UAMH 11346) TaxID=1262450 RepID=S3C3D4_OPHP1|nr:hypothetical protein F503_00827 [Ophiostoma piceae UAMH 11346]
MCTYEQYRSANTKCATIVSVDPIKCERSKQCPRSQANTIKKISTEMCRDCADPGYYSSSSRSSLSVASNDPWGQDASAPATAPAQRGGGGRGWTVSMYQNAAAIYAAKLCTSMKNKSSMRYTDDKIKIKIPTYQGFAIQTDDESQHIVVDTMAFTPMNTSAPDELYRNTGLDPDDMDYSDEPDDEDDDDWLIQDE